MRIAIMQPYLFPYAGYFSLISAVDKFIILDDVTYINKGWINRNRILVNGEPSLFSIPLQKASQNRLILDTKVCTENKWRNKLLKTVELAYKKAPFFTDVYPIVEHIILKPELHLSVLVRESLEKLITYIGIDTEIVNTSSIYENNHLKGQNRIIDICLLEHADKYINAEGGVHLYEKQKFAGNGIELLFIKSILNPYRQFDHQFVSGLSIIDLLMFNSKEEVQTLIGNYHLE